MVPFVVVFVAAAAFILVSGILVMNYNGDKGAVSENLSVTNKSLVMSGPMVAIVISGHEMSLGNQSLPDKILMLVMPQNVTIYGMTGEKDHFRAIAEAPLREGFVDINGKGMVVMYDYHAHGSDGWRFEFQKSPSAVTGPLAVVATPYTI